MSQSRRTIDHSEIRQWAEARNGRPARVPGTGDRDDAGLLRIDFPEDSADENADEEELEEITWEEFFEKFDEKRLAFVYQERTAEGRESRFNRFVNR